MSSTTAKISCIILAGGRGSRAGGRDKGLIDYHGQALIEHVIQSLKTQVDDIVISANRNTESYQRYSDKVITDDSQDYRGPLSGIAACLPHCKHQLVLIVACDMPNLPTTLVQRLQQKLHDNAISIATVSNRHQLALLVHKDLQPSLQQRLDDNQLKLIQWVESFPYATTSFDDIADAFVNLNNIPASKQE
jgi:molybdenum cofactor guanylyltransferase